MADFACMAIDWYFKEKNNSILEKLKRVYVYKYIHVYGNIFMNGNC